MYKINRMFIIVFVILLAIPCLLVNNERDHVSLVDNKRLANFPTLEFTYKDISRYPQQVNTYLNDRVGLRDKLLYFSYILNDRLFDTVSHPSYDLGKNGHYFYAFNGSSVYEEYDFEHLEWYAAFVGMMQNYCARKDIDFYYFLVPTKALLYSEQLPDGVHFKFEKYYELVKRLDSRGVNYMDLSQMLLDQKAKGVQICDYKYDPGHLSSKGLFYCYAEILKAVSSEYPQVTELVLDDYDIANRETSLLGSYKYPYRETIEEVQAPEDTRAVKYNDFAGIRLSDNDSSSFEYYRNDDNKGGPTALILHGSHMDNAPAFIADEFYESYFVRSYNNIFYLPYYLNIIQPDIVIYEVADRTITNTFVSKASLNTVRFNPSHEHFTKLEQKMIAKINNGDDFFALLVGDKYTSRLFTYEFELETDTEIGYAYIKTGSKWMDLEMRQEGGIYLLSTTLDREKMHGVGHIEIMLVSAESKSIQYITISQ